MLDILSCHGYQQYPAVSDVFSYGCHLVPGAFDGTANGIFYFEYQVFNGTHGICKFIGVQFHVVAKGYCNTVKYRSILYGN